MKHLFACELSAPAAREFVSVDESDDGATVFVTVRPLDSKHDDTEIVGITRANAKALGAILAGLP